MAALICSATFAFVDVTLGTVVSLLIFLAVFAGIVVWTFTRGRRELNHWSNLPLEDGVSQSPVSTQERAS